MNRRAFLKAGASTTALLLSHRAWCAQEKKAKPADDEILAQTKARIEQHRQGDGTITLRNANGKPVRGATVKVEQLRHDFLFGSNFFMFDRCRKPELEQQYRQRFTSLLNYCTLGFYWANYERERGKPHYEYMDQVVAWTRQRGITCKGHPLVWDHPAGSPGWLPDDPKEIERLSATRVREIISRYKGRIDIWDVVNEATHLPDKRNQTKMAEWAAALGAVPYVAEHLKVARAANPHATLLANDHLVGLLRSRRVARGGGRLAAPRHVPQTRLRAADVIDQGRLVDEDGGDHGCPERSQSARLFRHASRHSPVARWSDSGQRGSLGARQQEPV